MPQEKHLLLLRDWIFHRLVGLLNSGEWMVKIKDFRKSRSKAERNYFGLTNFDEQIIYLDKRSGTPRILGHELGHVAFVELLESEGEKRDRGRRKDTFPWEERQILCFEEYFYNSLSVKQIAILQYFIDDAHSEYGKDR